MFLPSRSLLYAVLGATMLVVVAGLAACSRHGGVDVSPEEATLVAVGDPAPPITLQTLAGDRFDLADQAGKVVLVNFWATWCPPCREEMPHLRERLWRRFGDHPDFAMISIAREETAEKIGAFVAAHGYEWTFAPDPDRAVFARYAESYIPRNFVVGRDGTIVYLGQGFEAEEFAAMVEFIAGQLRATP